MWLFYRWERFLLHFAGQCLSFAGSPQMDNHPRLTQVAPETYGVCGDLRKTEAEDLLDWLEAKWILPFGDFVDDRTKVFRLLVELTAKSITLFCRQKQKSQSRSLFNLAATVVNIA